MADGEDSRFARARARAERRWFALPPVVLAHDTRELGVALHGVSPEALHDPIVVQLQRSVPHDVAAAMLRELATALEHGQVAELVAEVDALAAGDVVDLRAWRDAREAG